MDLSYDTCYCLIHVKVPDIKDIANKEANAGKAMGKGDSQMGLLSIYTSVAIIEDSIDVPPKA